MLKGTVSRLPHRLGEKGSASSRLTRAGLTGCSSAGVPEGSAFSPTSSPSQDFVSHPGCSGPEIHQIGWAPSIQNSYDKRKSMRPSAMFDSSQLCCGTATTVKFRGNIWRLNDARDPRWYSPNESGGCHEKWGIPWRSEDLFRAGHRDHCHCGINNCRGNATGTCFAELRATDGAALQYLSYGFPWPYAVR